MFAGVGGFRLGLEKHGFETVWFNQWEPSKKRQDAHDCYVQHFGDFPDLPDGTGTNTDISLVDKNLIPDHALVVGGFPCQDYSVARSGAEGLTGRGVFVMLSGRDTPGLRGLYEGVPGVSFIGVDVQHCLAAREGESGVVRELIVKNY